MTIFYVDSAATGTDAGTSWTNAWTSLASAFTNVTTAGDVVYVSHTHNEQLSTDTTYIVGGNHLEANPLRIYSVNKSNDALTAGAFVGHDSSNRSITLNSGADVGGLFVYGLIFKTSGSVSDSLSFSVSSRGNFRFENCQFLNYNTSSLSRIILLSASSGINGRIYFKNCSFGFGHESQGLRVQAGISVFENCNMHVGSTYPTTILLPNSSGGSSETEFIGCDLSNIDNVLGYTSNRTYTVRLTQCKMKSGFVLINTPTGNQNRCFLQDCFSGDEHYHFQFSDGLGTLQVDTGIYCNDAITDTPLSWKVVSTSNASLITPFVTPWISVYHSGTSAITPYLEIVRSGSSTAFTDAEVWAEWSYKGTSGSTQATMADDRCALLGTPSNQTSSSKTASNWTGENATSWFGKIGPGSSLTPAESGDLAFRICVGIPSETVYVDPQIRGLA